MGLSALQEDTMKKLDEIPQLGFNATDTISGKENVLRLVATAFFNRGTFDARFREAEANWHGTVTELRLLLMERFGAQVQDEFEAWAEGEPVAKLAVTCALQGYVRVGSYHNPKPGEFLIEFMIDRFKAVTGYNRKRMPKDLQKSFHKKASNRLRKFYAQWKQSPDLQQKSVSEWLEEACSDEVFVWNKHLSEINQLYRKTTEFEPLDEGVIAELMRQAQIVDVMSS